MKGKIDIYKASAGSGKTFRLAGEYIKMLFSDEYEYRHILAVTFTNKATDQMKHRILSELYLLSKHPEKSAYIDEIISYTHKSAAQVAEYAGSVLKRILHDYSAFNISTIDTFFQSVMRSFSRELGRMATYNVEIDDRQIISMVIDRMFLSLERSENSRLLDWLIKYSLENIEEGRSWRIKNNILDLSKNLNSESFKIKNRGKSGYSNPECYMEQIQRLKERIADVERSYEEDIKDLAGQAIRIIEGGDLTLPDFKWGSRSPFARFWKFADGSAVSPYTAATFSNMTFVGPKADKSFQNTTDYINGGDVYPNNGSALGKFQSVMHLRRNTKLHIYNSVAYGWPIGVIIDNQKGDAQGNATKGDLVVNNFYLADMDILGSDFNAIYEDKKVTDYTTSPVTLSDTEQSFSHTYFLAQSGNKYLNNIADLGMTAGSYIPNASSILLNAASFTGITNNWLDPVSYVGAFDGTNDWTAGWTNFDPQNTVY